MKATNKAWAVLRFSTSKQGENSLQRQMDNIERWCARFGVEVAGCSMDPETSRTKEHTARPGLMEAIEQIKSGKAGVLIAESVSRLGDNAILMALRKELRKCGRVAVTSDSGSEMDEDLQEMAAIFSKVEVRQIRQRTKGALAMKRMRGEAYTTPPYGKRLRADGLHTERDGRPKCAGTGCTGCKFMEDDPAEQLLISRAKELAGTMCTFAVAKRLADEGYVGRMGKKLSHVQVGRILERVRQEAA